MCICVYVALRTGHNITVPTVTPVGPVLRSSFRLSRGRRRQSPQPQTSDAAAESGVQNLDGGGAAAMLRLGQRRHLCPLQSRLLRAPRQPAAARPAASRTITHKMPIILNLEPRPRWLCRPPSPPFRVNLLDTVLECSLAKDSDFAVRSRTLRRRAHWHAANGTDRALRGDGSSRAPGRACQYFKDLGLRDQQGCQRTSQCTVRLGAVPARPPVPR